MFTTFSYWAFCLAAAFAIAFARDSSRLSKHQARANAGCAGPRSGRSAAAGWSLRSIPPTHSLGGGRGGGGGGGGGGGCVTIAMQEAYSHRPAIACAGRLDKCSSGAPSEAETRLALHAPVEFGHQALVEDLLDGHLQPSSASAQTFSTALDSSLVSHGLPLRWSTHTCLTDAKSLRMQARAAGGRAPGCM